MLFFALGVPVSRKAQNSSCENRDIAAKLLQRDDGAVVQRSVGAVRIFESCLSKEALDFCYGITPALGGRHQENGIICDR
jgi:hypothetical protein